MEQVRVRFAPSPTGYLHIGGARTALFNWFFARRHQGRFILRIEDTDTERLKEDSVSQNIDSLKWLGLDWDEGPEKGGEYGPYFQSQRLDFYTAAANQLIRSGKAYYCFCTAAELEAEREKQSKAGVPFRYSGKCRELPVEEVERRLTRGEKPVIRLKLPQSGHLVVADLIRGQVRFDFEQLDDFIIVKSNGLPTYNFACVVDDHAMRISHVIRAEEHLSNTPKQQYIYEALGYQVPAFAHLPMILAPDRSKLSKRHGATSVSEFKEMGILPEALVNYLTLLGWSPGDKQGEIFTPEQTLQSFSLDRVSKTAAIYDLQKLIWLNGQYITHIDLDNLVDQAIPFLVQGGVLTGQEAAENREYLVTVIRTVRERVRTLPELVEACRYFYRDVTSYDEQGVKKYFRKPGVAELLLQGRETLAGVEEFTVENTEKAYRSLMERLNIKGGEIIHPTRLALTGRTVSPGLFDVIAVLGKTKCLERLDKALQYIRENRLEQDEGKEI